MPFRLFARCLTGIVLFVSLRIQAAPIAETNNQTTAANPMTITADLTDAPRKLLHAEIQIPVKPGPFTFTAAKWIPGSHSPTGPIGEFAGIVLGVRRR